MLNKQTKSNLPERAISFITENLMLIAILACVSIAILVRSYFNGYYISPDSTGYLRAAREILRGNGFYVYSDLASWPYSAWFAAWPIGYPFLIAATSFITRTEIYLASKILTIIIVWIIGITFYKRFASTAWVYALVMLNVGFLEIFYFTWSEIPFILGLVLCSFWTADIITEDTIEISQYIKLTLCALLLFLSRYIGAFSIGVIGSLWVFNAWLALKRKDKNAKKRLIYLTASGAITGIFIFSYLLLNREMTGHMTGTLRYPPVNTKRELLLQLYNAQLTEMNNVFGTFFSIENMHLAFPLWVLFAGFVIYMVMKNIEGLKKRDKNITTPICFIAIGGMYWCAIVAMRFSSQFDPFSRRLLAPSSIMLCIGFIGLLICDKKTKSTLVKVGGIISDVQKKDSITKYVNILVVVSFAFFLLISTAIVPQLSASPSYRAMKETKLAIYAPIPDGAMVLWGDQYLLYYLRDNLSASFNVNPWNESVENFLRIYDSYEQVYVYIPGMKERMDADLAKNEEVYKYFEQYKDREEVLVRIK